MSSKPQYYLKGVTRGGGYSVNDSVRELLELQRMAMEKNRVFSLLTVLVLWFMISGKFLQTAESLTVGINYGQIANNLPSPTRVAGLVSSLNISKVKLYDADPNVLRAFLNSQVEFIIGIGNENVANMTDYSKALSWVQNHIQPYLPRTRITCVTVGNEVYSGNDTTLKSNLLPAMQSIYAALVALGLDKQVNVTTAHSVAILGNSYPPSAGSFRPDVAEFIQPLLNFHAMANSPFLINVYPFFAYKDNPDSISLDYVLFRPNSGITDPNTNLNYDNMLYAQVDSVYSAISAMGHPNIDVRISETGWPSRGDPDEVGATPENAAIYNGNLLQRIAMQQGTPLKPSVPIEVYVFALFNENLKPGPTSERNYGLYYPDGNPVYNIGLNGRLPSMSSSASNPLTLLPELVLFMLVTVTLFWQL
ncbi:Glycoside hydrolase family 17 protein [Dioscorea alata]|uniref:Glycoside hydrolase family 17 protein n=3 Tax=Dioscorea alata TaxID=55571 RepID=A0ACB7VZY5_DIOAL|nr:Glycoside hydrolase family 17 protein [Dioscorea alata]KAH7680669.1 Glycoside hydrolase family 17 protein [Dioscorea alata]KAH7680670.1 Glycoside hydrolase family 17 protein [Dioscorea alata]